jgi:hypothetical protein
MNFGKEDANNPTMTIAARFSFPSSGMGRSSTSPWGPSSTIRPSGRRTIFSSAPSAVVHDHRRFGQYQGHVPPSKPADC